MGWLAATLAAAAALVAPAPAGAVWSEPRDLSNTVLDRPLAVRSAMGPDGTAAVVWQDDAKRLFLAVRSPGGSFGAPELLGNAAMPAVAVGPDGEILVAAVMAGDGGARVVALTRRPGAPWERADLAPARDVRPIEAAFDGDGGASVAWHTRLADGFDELRVAARPPGGEWLATATVAREDSLSFHDFAVAGNGDAAVAWSAWRPGGDALFVAIRPGALGAFGAPRVFPDDETVLRRTRAHVAAGGDGRIAVAWRETFEQVHGARAVAAVREPGGELGPLEVVADGGWVQGLAVGPLGEVVAACICAFGDGDDRIEGLIELVRDPAGMWRAPARATAGLGYSWTSVEDPGPHLAFDGAGDLHAVWAGSDVETEQASMQASLRDDGAWSGPRTVSHTGIFIGAPSAAAGPPGEAVAAWVRIAGDESRVQASLWTPGPDPPPPPPAPLPEQPAAASQSTHFQGDAGRTGRLAGTGLAPPLVEAWRRRTAANLYVVTAGGLAFLLEPRDGTVNVVALDLRTGDERWATPLTGVDGMRDVALAYAAGRVFAVGHVSWALDATSGAELWRSSVAQWYGSAPAVVDGLVVFNASGIGDTLYGLDAGDGRQRLALAIGGAGGPLAFGDGVAVAAGSSGRAMAVEIPSGALRWRHDEGSSGGGEHVTAFDGAWFWSEEMPLRGRVFDEDGTVVKRFDGGAPAFDRPLAVNASGNALVAVDERSFETRWRHEHVGTLSSMPLIADGVVYAASESGEVIAVDRDTGELLWAGVAGAMRPAWDEPATGLAAACGYLLVPTQSALVAYRSALGAPAECPPPDDGAPPPGNGEQPPPDGEQPPPDGGGDEQAPTGGDAPPATADPPPAGDEEPAPGGDTRRAPAGAAPGAAPTTRARALLRLRRAQSLRRALARGLRARLVAPGARSALVVATARLRDRRSGRVRRVVVGRARTRVRAGRATVRVRFRRSARRALARRSRVTVSLRVVSRLSDGRRARGRATVVLRARGRR